MPRSPSGRRRGGQPGNTNRLVHGLYSTRIPRKIHRSLENPRTTSEPDFEIALARVRLVQLMRAQQAAPAREYLTYERAVINYLDLIFSLTEAAARRRRNGPELEGILAAFAIPTSPILGRPHGIRTSFEPQSPWPETSRD